MAQTVPGYLGKRLFINYEAQFFPAFRTPNGEDDLKYASDYDDSEFSTSLNYLHNINFSYIYSKKSAVGLNISYQSSYSYIDNVFKTENGFNKINAIGFNLTLKSFIKHIAPIGLSIEPKIGFSLVTPEDFLLVFDLSEVGGEAGETLISGQTKILYNVGIGYTISRVVADKFMFSYGFDLNFSIPGLALFVFDEEFSSLDPEIGNDPVNQDALADRALARIAVRNLLNFRIGIGYLL